MISAVSRRRLSSGNKGYRGRAVIVVGIRVADAWNKMKSAILYCLLLLSVGVCAQVDTTRGRLDSVRHTGDGSRQTMAIFAPLYLDSAFDASGAYRYDKNFPKWISPGLEFY